MIGKIVLIIVGLLIILGGLAYVGVNRPWWNEGHELKRVFMDSGVSLTGRGGRGGNLLCMDACPSFGLGLTSNPDTFAGVTNNIEKALNQRGYVLQPDNFKETDSQGQTVTSPYKCIAPDPTGLNSGGDTKDWVCSFNASAGKYTITGRVFFNGSARPTVTYRDANETVAAALPSQARLLDGGVTIFSHK